eukprot:726059-Prorocentrum_minimum.AAC.1
MRACSHHSIYDIRRCSSRAGSGRAVGSNYNYYLFSPLRPLDPLSTPSGPPLDPRVQLLPP